MKEIPRDFIQSYKEPFGFKAALGQIAVGFAAGVLAGLGHAPFSLVFLSLPGFAAIFWLVRRAATPKGSTILGWAAGAGYFTVTLFWIVEPFLVDVARHGWMAPFALILTAGGFGLFWGIAARLARWLAGNDPSTLALGVAWVCALSMAEYARSLVFTGFPWAMPGYIWSQTAFAQLGGVLGPHGLNFLTLAFATALTGLAFPSRVAKLAGVLGAVGPVLITVGLQSLLPPLTQGAGPMLRLVQPNAPQHQKWKPEMIPGFFQTGLDLTGAPAQTPPEIVIWPETSAPRLLGKAGADLRKIATAAGGADVIIGAIRRDEKGPYNSMVVVSPDGAISDLYDKHHLVPFGEYVPLIPSLAALGWEELADTIGTGYQAGQGEKLMAASKGGAFQPLICYEAIFPNEVGSTDVRPAWLLQITNDAWFGKIAGPYQHLAQARMRAIEQGLPLVRVANTGVTAVIDARGRVVASLPFGEAGYLDARLPGALQATAYSLLGDWPILGLILLCAMVTFIQRKRNTD